MLVAPLRKGPKRHPPNENWKINFLFIQSLLVCIGRYSGVPDLFLFYLNAILLHDCFIKIKAGCAQVIIIQQDADFIFYFKFV